MIRKMFQWFSVTGLMATGAAFAYMSLAGAAISSGAILPLLGWSVAYGVAIGSVVAFAVGVLDATQALYLKGKTLTNQLVASITTKLTVWFTNIKNYVNANKVKTGLALFSLLSAGITVGTLPAVLTVQAIGYALLKAMLFAGAGMGISAAVYAGYPKLLTMLTKVQGKSFKKEKQNLAKTVGELRINIKQWKQFAANLKEDNRILRGVKTSQEELVSALNKQVELLNKDKDEQEKKIKNIEVSVENVLKENRDLQGSVQAKNALIEKLKQNAETLRLGIEKLRDEKASEIAKLKGDVDSLTNEKKVLEEHLKVEKEKLGKSEEKVEKFKADLGKESKALSELKSGIDAENAKLKNNILNLGIEINNLKHEKLRLENSFNEKVVSLQGLVEEKKVLEKQLEVEKENLGKSEETAADSKKQIEELLQLLETKENSLRMMQDRAEVALANASQPSLNQSLSSAFVYSFPPQKQLEKTKEEEEANRSGSDTKRKPGRPKVQKTTTKDEGSKKELLKSTIDIKDEGSENDSEVESDGSASNPLRRSRRSKVKNTTPFFNSKKDGNESDDSSEKRKARQTRSSGKK